jgi:hypothetical protein
MSHAVLSEDFASDAAIAMTMHNAKPHSGQGINFEVRVMVSKRRRRDIFVVSNPMPDKLRQERHIADLLMPLRWSSGIWFGSRLQIYRTSGAAKGDHSGF